MLWVYNHFTAHNEWKILTLVYILDTHSCNLPLTVWVIYPFQLRTHHISQCGNPSLSATGRRRGASHAHWSADSASPLPSKASYWPMVGPVTARRFGDAKKPLYACITGNTRLLLLHDSCICRIQCIYYTEYFVYSGLWLLSLKWLDSRYVKPPPGYDPNML